MTEQPGSSDPQQAAGGAAPSCRFCGARLEHVFADLGATPLANANLTPGAEAAERRFPLIVRTCGACLMTQADSSVPPEHIFSDYDYFSSFSSGWVEHARRYAHAMIGRFGLGPGSLVVEIAANDGYLLEHFKTAGIPVLGVEPAANVAAAATAKGIPMEVRFFHQAAAAELAARYGKADLMAANNVLAHVPDTRSFMAGFAGMLAAEGVATFEFPHILRMIEGLQFDTIYHEHFFYLSLGVVERIAASAGLRVFDVEELPTHGGSLRVFVCHEAASHPVTGRVADVRRAEHEAALDRIDGYLSFNSRIGRARDLFLDFLARARRDGRTVAAYGAAAKGNTFLNFCGVGPGDIGAVFDRNPAKQGKLTPGSHIPIRPPGEIAELRPHYLVILPWNIAGEIRATVDLAPWGGRFVAAIPETRVLDP